MFTDFVVEVSPSVKAEKEIRNNTQANSSSLEITVEETAKATSTTSIYNFTSEALW